MKTLILIFTLLITGFSASSQDRHRAAALLTRAVAKFGSVDAMQFSVQYRYANESAPAHTLDTLSGTFKMASGGRFNCRLAGTQMVSDGDRSISVFDEAKLIYLTKAVKHPLAGVGIYIHSLLERDDIAIESEAIDSLIVIRVNFASPSPIKTLTYKLSNSSGLILAITQVVDSRLLYEGGALDNSTTDDFAIVEMAFFNYRFDPVYADEFEIDKFVVKTNDRYIAAFDLKGYQVVSEY